ncbi:MAG: hypothetical protein JO209_02575 [Acidisphaera sp.]|nr:hypothetical protein [Acidisphaera sp.]
MTGGKIVDNSFRRIALAQGLLPVPPAESSRPETEDQPAESEPEAQPAQA